VHVYNCKGNALEYSSYRAKILLEHVMTIYGWVVEVRVSIAKIVVTQFGFMAAKLTTDATLIARQLQQNCRAKNEEQKPADGKAFDRVVASCKRSQWMWCGVWCGLRSLSEDERSVTGNIPMVTDSPLAFTVYRHLCG